MAHACFLTRQYGCGPHTISFPRIRPAHGVQLDPQYLVSDYDFTRLVAILRLSVPYTGMILTAREPADVRREVMEFGVSQIDAGTRIELAGYTKDGEQDMRREQFQIGDVRSLDEILADLMEHDYLPSFCTSCYRVGRTGEHFMEFAIPGFIEKFCTPNGLFTLAEYIEDYGSEETKAIGDALIERELSRIDEGPKRDKVVERLAEIREQGLRDVYY